MCIGYLEERTRAHENERRVQEENELLRLEKRDLQNTMQNVLTKTEVEVKQSTSEAERKGDEVVLKYRQQAQIQGENLQIIQVLSALYITKGTIQTNPRNVFSEDQSLGRTA